MKWHKYFILLIFEFIFFNRPVKKRRVKLGKILRILSFAYPYLFDNIPLFYRVGSCQTSLFIIIRYLMELSVLCSRYHFWLTCLAMQIFVCVGEDCTVNEATMVHYQHAALALLTGFLFASHLPERLAPGSFDYIGTL